MTAIPRSATPRDANPLARGASSNEIYGGENLPVLVRLPDLTNPAEPAPALANRTLPVDLVNNAPLPDQPVPDCALPDGTLPDCAAPADRAVDTAVSGTNTAAENTDTAITDTEASASAADDPTDAPATIPLKDYQSDAEYVESESSLARTPLAEAPPTEPPREQRLRQQRQARRARVTRRDERRAALPRWLRGVSQLVFAGVLAAVLLAVVVTLKNWNAPAGQPTQPDQDISFVEAPPLDMSVETPSPAPTEGLRGPELSPPSFGDPSFGNHGSTLNNTSTTGAATTHLDTPVGSAPFTMGAAAQPTQPARSVPPAFAERQPISRAPQYPSTNYPTTGAKPIVAAPGAAAVENVRRWSGAVPAGEVRSAELPVQPHDGHQHR